MKTCLVHVCARHDPRTCKTKIEFHGYYLRAIFVSCSYAIVCNQLYSYITILGYSKVTYAPFTPKLKHCLVKHGLKLFSL